MSHGQSIRDASHLCEAERRVQHAAPPRLSHYGVAARADAEGAVAARGRRPHMTQHGHRLRVTAVS